MEDLIAFEHRIQKFRPNGELDPELGLVVLPHPRWPLTVVVPPGGRRMAAGTVLGGGNRSGSGLNRFDLATGQVDPSFHPTFELAEGMRTQVAAVVAQSDVKLLVAGNFSRANGQPRPGLVRLQSDGSVDTNFVPGFESRIEARLEVSAIQLERGGRILVGTGTCPTEARGTRSEVCLHDWTFTADCFP